MSVRGCSTSQPAWAGPDDKARMTVCAACRAAESRRSHRIVEARAAMAQHNQVESLDGVVRFFDTVTRAEVPELRSRLRFRVRNSVT